MKINFLYDGKKNFNNNSIKCEGDRKYMSSTLFHYNEEFEIKHYSYYIGITRNGVTGASEATT